MPVDRLIECLLDGQVDFVVIGGLAAVLHGSTLVTRDVDICIPLGAESLLGLQEALRPLNPRVRAGSELIPLILDAPQASKLKNLYILTDEGRLDCLGSVAGVGEFAAVARESIEIDIAGRRCRLLGIEALIRAKEATDRPHDRETVIQLRAIQERSRGGGSPSAD
jgi:hypothetical protein